MLFYISYISLMIGLLMFLESSQTNVPIWLLYDNHVLERIRGIEFIQEPILLHLVDFRCFLLAGKW